jgi:HPt (histidine-containing phosphotransfer) domain-containing protein
MMLSDNKQEPASSARTNFARNACQMLIKRLRPAAAAAEPDQGGASPVEPAVLDAASLGRLRELDPKGENHLIERVVKAFDGSVARLLSQLHDAHRSSDLNGVRHVAHTLKSSSASIGALKLSQICAEIETMVRLEKTEGLDGRLDEMSSEIVKVQAALRLLADGES